MKRLRLPQIAILLGAGVAACSDYRADPKLSAPVWATLEPSLKRCGRSPLKIDAPSRDRALILTHGTYTRHLSERYRRLGAIN
ncbi:hypothetical protein HaLaN_00438, partial [Haematococcus lacustris]